MFNRFAARCLCSVTRSTNKNIANITSRTRSTISIRQNTERLYSSAIIQTQCSRLRIHSLLYSNEVNKTRQRSLSSERRKKVVPQQLTFQRVNELIKSDEVVVVDVRDPKELTADGKITNKAKNIPLAQIPSSLTLSDEEFNEAYGFDKPSPDQEIVFHCKMGIRAAQAAHAYADAGYRNIRIYPGIVDWTENGGKLEQ